MFYIIETILLQKDFRLFCIRFNSVYFEVAIKAKDFLVGKTKKYKSRLSG